MANERLGMIKIRQVIRLFSEGCSLRSISFQLNISREAVTKYSSLFKASKLNYSDIEKMSDIEILSIFENATKSGNKNLEKLISTFPLMEKELNKIGMTKLIIWSKYKFNNPDGYNYSRFCHYFTQWRLSNKSSMHFEHKSGDKMYIDFTGKKLNYTDRSTGEIREVEVFVAVLGASQLTYVEAVTSQRKEDFIRAVENALYYFKGVPQAIVPDNLKSAVSKSNKYEPQINETFADFALHYGTTILPTRSYKPKDKALVEGAVKIIYTRIFTEINNEIHFSLGSLNKSISHLLEKYNDIKLTGRQQSRREIYQTTELCELKPLPINRYEIKNYQQATVYKTSHIWLSADEHYYSVPYRYINRKVQIIYTSNEVEIYYNHDRISFHKRDYRHHTYSTISEHMPSSHQFVAEWCPDKFIKWAKDIGSPTEELIRIILQTKSHPEQGYKSCIGILSFGKKYGNNRLNSACSRAISYNSYNYMTVKNILEKGLDKHAIKQEEQYKLPYHENIRGSQYYR
jgi:transposase